MPLKTDKIDDAALALLYLTLHDGSWAWKSLDWDALGRLHDQGMIDNPASKRKSVAFTDEAGAREGVVRGNVRKVVLSDGLDPCETHRDNRDMRWVSQELNPSYGLSAWAALRLRTNANFAGRWTGRSSPCFHCMKPSARTFPVARLAVPTPQICRSLTQA